MKVVFSDGSDLKLDMKKSNEAQMFSFESKQIKWLELCELEKAEDASPFPALMQIEVYGVDASAE